MEVQLTPAFLEEAFKIKGTDSSPSFKVLGYFIEEGEAPLITDKPPTSAPILGYAVNMDEFMGYVEKVCAEAVEFIGTASGMSAGEAESNDDEVDSDQYAFLAVEWCAPVI